MAFIKFMKGAIVGSEQPKYETLSKTDVSILFFLNLSHSLSYICLFYYLLLVYFWYLQSLL